MSSLSQKIIVVIGLLLLSALLLFIALYTGNTNRTEAIVLSIAKWLILVYPLWLIAKKQKPITQQALKKRYDSLLASFLIVISILLGLTLSSNINPAFKINGVDIYLIILIGEMSFIGSVYLKKYFSRDQNNG